MNLELMQQLSQEVHSRCFACGDNCNEGLGLRFNIENDKVASIFKIDKKYQGYNGIVHGGITASILDCAMVHCLFALGIKALTIELTTKYRHAIEIEVETEVNAWLVSESHGLYSLKAQICQGNKTKAEATGRFYRATANS